MTVNRCKGEPAPSGTGKTSERKARLAAALRENLRKRKRQKTARKTAAPPPERDGDGA